jgi:hypothetical protein
MKNVVEKWDVFEISLTSGKKYPNPFTDVKLKARFCHNGQKAWFCRYCNSACKSQGRNSKQYFDSPIYNERENGKGL